jgi:hypothetical protein
MLIATPDPLKGRPGVLSVTGSVPLAQIVTPRLGPQDQQLPWEDGVAVALDKPKGLTALLGHADLILVNLR